MISSNNPFHNPSYDPMAIQFMTGGQMGYMPQAQYLSSPDYGAFRTLPSPHEGIMPMQRPSLWQAYMTTSRGSPLGMLPEYMLNNRMMGVDQSMYHAMAGRRVEDAKGVFGAMAGGMAATTALSYGLALGNPLLALGIGAAMPDLAAPLVDRMAQQRRIQDMTMSRITTGPDMASGLGQGFSLPAAARLDDSVRQMSSEDLLFKEDDYREIMRTGIEHGLFDYAHSGEEYKRTLKQLRDNLNIVGELLGSTDFKELLGSMKRLMTMGAEINQMGEITHMERMFSRMTGMRHQDMVNTFGQQGALTYSRLGLTNYQGSLAAMSHAAGITMSQRLGLLSPAEVARSGGVSGMAQDYTQQQGMVTKKLQNFILPAFANEDFTGLGEHAADLIDQVMSGKMSFNELSKGANRLDTVGKRVNYDGNIENIQQGFTDLLGPLQSQMFLHQLARSVGQSAGIEDDRTAAVYGYRMFDMPEAMAVQLADQWQSVEFGQAHLTQNAAELRKINFSAMEEFKHSQTITNRMATGWRQMTHELARPWQALSERRAIQAQQREDLDMGVLSVTAPGPRTAGSLNELSQTQMDMLLYGKTVDQMVTDHTLEHPTQAEIDYSIAITGHAYGEGTLKAERAAFIEEGRNIRRLADPENRLSVEASMEFFDQFKEQGLDTQHLDFSAIQNLDDLTSPKMYAAVWQAVDRSGVADPGALYETITGTEGWDAAVVGVRSEDDTFRTTIDSQYKEKLAGAPYGTVAQKILDHTRERPTQDDMDFSLATTRLPYGEGILYGDRESYIEKGRNIRRMVDPDQRMSPDDSREFFGQFEEQGLRLRDLDFRAIRNLDDLTSPKMQDVIRQAVRKSDAADPEALYGAIVGTEGWEKAVYGLRSEDRTFQMTVDSQYQEKVLDARSELYEHYDEGITNVSDLIKKISGRTWSGAHDKEGHALLSEAMGEDVRAGALYAMQFAHAQSRESITDLNPGFWSRGYSKDQIAEMQQEHVEKNWADFQEQGKFIGLTDKQIQAVWSSDQGAGFDLARDDIDLNLDTDLYNRVVAWADEQGGKTGRRHAAHVSSDAKKAMASMAYQDVSLRGEEVTNALTYYGGSIDSLNIADITMDLADPSLPAAHRNALMAFDRQWEHTGKFDADSIGRYAHEIELYKDTDTLPDVTREGQDPAAESIRSNMEALQKVLNNLGFKESLDKSTYATLLMTSAVNKLHDIIPLAPATGHSHEYEH